MSDLNPLFAQHRMWIRRTYHSVNARPEGSVIPKPLATPASEKPDGSSISRIQKFLCEARESTTHRASQLLILRLLRWQTLFVVRHCLLPQIRKQHHVSYKLRSCSVSENGTVIFLMTANRFVPLHS